MRKHLLAMFVFCLPAMSYAQGLQPLDDAALASVTGQQGVALDLEYRQNMEEDGAGDYRPIQAAPFNSCQGTGNPCTLSIQFNNRGTGGGEWVVLKDYYQRLKINNLFLDAGRLQNSDSGFGDPSRFEDGAGTCLTGITNGGGECTSNGSPALNFTFGGGSGDDIELFMRIGRLTVQYGPNAFLPANDAAGSALGLRISDTQQQSARINVGGNVRIFGF